MSSCSAQCHDPAEFANLTTPVALLIGGVEALGLLSDQLALTGPFWDVVGSLNDSFGYLGFAVVSIFVLCWAASTIIYGWQG